MSASVSAAWHYVTGGFVSLCLLGGLLSNGSLIVMFIRNPSLRQARNFLLINLAITDLGLLATNNSLHAIASFNKQWPFGQKGCSLYAFCGGLCALTSIATMAAIALTRLVAVTDPLSSLKLTARFTLKCIVCSWLYGLTWMVAPLFGLNRFVFEGAGTSCTFDYVSTDVRSRLFIGMLMIGGFIIPLTIIIVSYCFILVKLSSRGRHLERRLTLKQTCYKQPRPTNMSCLASAHSSYDETGREKVKMLAEENANKQMKRVIRRTEIRVTRTALLVCGIYCVAWTPYALMTILFQLGCTRWLNVYTTSVVGLFSKISACVNPLIYALSSPMFRRHIFGQTRVVQHHMISSDFSVNKRNIMIQLHE